MTSPTLLKANSVDKNGLSFLYSMSLTKHEWWIWPTLNACTSFAMTFVSFKLLSSFCIGEL